MDQLTFIRPGEIEWQEVPAPKLVEERDALVRPLAVATCDLDTAIVHGEFPLPGPFPLGHEFVGEVVDAGDGAAIEAGAVVSVPFQISCGSCDACRAGLTGNCDTTPPLASYGLGPIGGLEWGGALSELVRVPFADHMLVPLPEGVDPVAAASLSDNIPDAYRTVGPYLADDPTRDVLVVGGAAQGSIGVYAAGIARAMASGKVDYIDHSPERRQMAEVLGATTVDLPPDGARAGQYHVTVDASGDPDGLATALRSTRRDGVCTSTAIYLEPVPMPLFEMYSAGLTFRTGRANSRADIPKVLELIADGRFAPERATATVAPWERAIEALAEHRLKLVITH